MPHLDPPLAVVVLAAGASTRLGQPKQLLPYGGQTLLRRAVTTALAAQLGPVAVVLGAQSALFKSELAELAVSGKEPTGRPPNPLRPWCLCCATSPM